MINIIVLEKGFAVKFPYELKDNFKSVFKSSKWNPDDRQWEVGPRSKKRLEQWIETVSGLAKEIEDLESAELTLQEIEKIKSEIKEIRSQIGLAQRKRETINAPELLSDAKSELEDAKKVLEKEKQALNDKLIESKELLEKVCDIDEIYNAVAEMRSTFGKVGAKNTDKFREAQRIIKEEHARLKKIGFESAGLHDLYSLNVNRPDRDRIGDCRSIYELSRIEKEK